MVHESVWYKFGFILCYTLEFLCGIYYGLFIVYVDLYGVYSSVYVFVCVCACISVCVWCTQWWDQIAYDAICAWYAVVQVDNKCIYLSIRFKEARLYIWHISRIVLMYQKITKWRFNTGNWPRVCVCARVCVRVCVSASVWAAGGYSDDRQHQTSQWLCQVTYLPRCFNLICLH